MESVQELTDIFDILQRCGYIGRVQLDSGIVRGSTTTTGPVFEAQLTFPAKNEDGETVVFGSVGGGGRYDDLIARFTVRQCRRADFRLASAGSSPCSKRAPVLKLSPSRLDCRVGAGKTASRELSHWLPICAKPVSALKPMSASPA